MTRWIAPSAGALAVTLTLGFAIPFGNEAAADGMKAPVYRPIYNHKMCIAHLSCGAGLRRPGCATLRRSVLRLAVGRGPLPAGRPALLLSPSRSCTGLGMGSDPAAHSSKGQGIPRKHYVGDPRG
jgi:hypothetical protein